MTGDPRENHWRLPARPSTGTGQPTRARPPAPVGRPTTAPAGPERETPSTWSQATWALILLNVAVFVVMVASGSSWFSPDSSTLISWGADFGPPTTRGEWWRLLTSMFVHVGVLHLALNMLALWLFGMIAEMSFGRAGTLLVYVFSGVCGAIASLFSNPYMVSAGASGAILGLLGAQTLYWALADGRITKSELGQLARTGLIAVAGAGAGSRGRAGHGIDIVCHLGGLGAGLFCGLILGLRTGVDPARGQTVRIATLALLGTGVAVAGVAYLPRAADLEGEAHRFSETERRNVGLFNDAVDRLKAGGMTGEELARLVEEQLLPEWDSAIERLSGLKGLPGRVGRPFELMSLLAQERKEFMRSTALAARSPGDARHERAASLHLKRMNQLVDQLNGALPVPGGPGAGGSDSTHRQARTHDGGGAGAGEPARGEAAACMKQARTHESLGELQLAAEVAKDCIRMDPDRREAYLLLDEMLSPSREWDTIISYWNQYLERHPRDAVAIFERSGTFDQTGDRARALSEARRACDLGLHEACDILPPDR